MLSKKYDAATLSDMMSNMFLCYKGLSFPSFKVVLIVVFTPVECYLSQVFDTSGLCRRW